MRLKRREACSISGWSFPAIYQPEEDQKAKRYVSEVDRRRDERGCTPSWKLNSEEMRDHHIDAARGGSCPLSLRCYRRRGGRMCPDCQVFRSKRKLLPTDSFAYFSIDPDDSSTAIRHYSLKLNATTCDKRALSWLPWYLPPLPLPRLSYQSVLTLRVQRPNLQMTRMTADNER